jgi:hypothetical protein
MQPFVDSASTFHDPMARLGGQADHCTKVIAPVSGARTPRTSPLAAAADPGRPHRVAHQAEV